MPSLLIIEDEKEASGYLKDYFQQLGFEVLTASTGEEGLSLILSSKPQVVLLDIRLGQGISGLEVLRKAKADKSASEVVMVTAVEDQNVAEMAKGLGACGYITKPFALEELERVVLSRLKTKPEAREFSD